MKRIEMPEWVDRAFAGAPWTRRIVGANVAVFLVLNVVLGLGLPEVRETVERVLVLQPAIAYLRPWTLLTYAFVHAGSMHILVNMIIVYFFGIMLERELTGRAFLLLYGGGAVVAALAYMMLSPDVPVVGASGAAMAMVAALATLHPNDKVFIWGVIPIALKWLAVGYAVMDLLGLMGYGQAGIANVAHLGGALFGFLWMRRRIATRGRALLGVEVRRPVQKVAVAVHEMPTRPRSGAPEREEALLDAVDRVLDKISQHGIASLTPEERSLLDEVSRRKQNH